MTNPTQAELKAALEILARYSVLEHLWAFVVDFFNFRFTDAMVDIMWAIQRAFKIGDYAEGGYFDQEGIKWREPKSKKQ